MMEAVQQSNPHRPLPPPTPRLPPRPHQAGSSSSPSDAGGRLQQHLAQLCLWAANAGNKDRQKRAETILKQHWPDVDWCTEHRALVESVMLTRKEQPNQQQQSLSSSSMSSTVAPQVHPDCLVCKPGIPPPPSEVVLALQSAAQVDFSQGMVALDGVHDEWEQARKAWKEAEQAVPRSGQPNANVAAKAAVARQARALERDLWLRYCAVVFDVLAPACYKPDKEARGKPLHRAYVRFVERFCGDHSRRNNQSGVPQLLCTAHPEVAGQPKTQAGQPTPSFPMLPTVGGVNCADHYHAACMMCLLKPEDAAVKVTPLPNTMTHEKLERMQTSLLAQKARAGGGGGDGQDESMDDGGGAGGSSSSSSSGWGSSGAAAAAASVPGAQIDDMMD